MCVISVSVLIVCRIVLHIVGRIGIRLLIIQKYEHTKEIYNV